MKNRLSEADYLQVLSCIESIHRCRQLEDFPRHVLAELRKLIECNLAGYNEVNVPRQRIVVVFDPLRPDLDQSVLEAFGRLMHQHPVINYFDQTGDGQALKISDFLSAREYQRREIYRDFYRHIEAKDQISFGVRIAPGYMIGIAFNRNSRSFTERDRLCLNLLRPHVIQAYLNAVEFSGYREKQIDLQAVLRESGVGVISLNSAGAVLHSTPGAFDCLARYFPMTNGTYDTVPERIVKWMRSNGAGDSSEPLIAGHGLSRLIVRRVRSEEDRVLLLLSEESSNALEKKLEQFPITPREREVLRWMSEGKSNAEIGVILGMKTGTVKLHVERILAKMGVENRTAAALMVHGVKVN